MTSPQFACRVRDATGALLCNDYSLTEGHYCGRHGCIVCGRARYEGKDTCENHGSATIADVRRLMAENSSGSAAKLVPGHFDNPPSGAITAEQVRAKEREQWICPACRSSHFGIAGEPPKYFCHDEHACGCKHSHPHNPDAVVHEFALRGLLTHPGVSSTARAVIDEALR